MAAETDPRERTDRWLQSQFAKYYAHADLDLPARFTKREWAFLFFSKSFMVRHLSFGKRDQLRAYLRDQAPRHAYYSTAFYEDPGAHTMPEKGWKGATLIFDLDADHLKGASSMGYAQMLAEVKIEFVKLVDRWLIGKLGYDADEVGIVFSGGRGYHAHIEDPRVWEFGSYERREVMDLISGNPIDIEKYFVTSSPETVYHAGKTTTGRGYSKKSFMMPPDEKGNWRGDITGEALHFFKEIEGLVSERRRPEAVQRIKDYWKTDDIRAISLLEQLFKPDIAGIRAIDRILSNRIIDFDEGLNKKFWTPFFEGLFVQTLGQADEPVTSDIKRLIRLPSSLHGKTGFRVCRLTRDELTDFDPLTDSLAFSHEDIEIRGLADTTFDLGGEQHTVETDRISVLPEYAAVFAALRGAVAIHARSGE